MNTKRKCPNCFYPVQHGGNGYLRRICSHCGRAIPKSMRRTNRPRFIGISADARMLISALEKLDIERSLLHTTADLSATEWWAVKSLLRAVIAAAIECNNKGQRPPRMFRFAGGKVNIEYTEAGEIRLRSTSTGRQLVASLPGVGW